MDSQSNLQEETVEARGCANVTSGRSGKLKRDLILPAIYIIKYRILKGYQKRYTILIDEVCIG
jgi:hypothetical protein